MNHRPGLRLELWQLYNASRLRRQYVRIVGWTFIGGWMRLREVQKTLQDLPMRPASILDAGCGEGAFSLALADMFPHASIDALDWEATERFAGQLQRVQDMLSAFGLNHVSVRKTDLLQFHDQNKYDLIINVDVLEHIQGNKNVLQTFLAALRPGGYLVLHMPAAGHPAKSRFFPESALLALNEEHVGEMYDKGELGALLKGLGYDHVHVCTTFHWLGQTAWEWDRIIYQKAYFLYPVLLPCLKVMAWLDLHFKFGRGFGLLAVAQRPETG